MSFNLIDIAIIVLVLLSVLNGWRRGFILGVLDLLGWVLVFIAGLRFYQPVARWLGAHVDLWSEVWNRPIAFVAIAILAGGFVQIVGNVLLRRVPKEVHERTFNQVARCHTGPGKRIDYSGARRRAAAYHSNG